MLATESLDGLKRDMLAGLCCMKIRHTTGDEDNQNVSHRVAVPQNPDRCVCDYVVTAIYVDQIHPTQRLATLAQALDLMDCGAEWIDSYHTDPRSVS